MTPPGPKKRIRSSSVRSAFREIVWPRRRLVGLGLVLILVNRSSGMVLPASTKFLIDDVLGGERPGLLAPILAALVAATSVQAATSFALTRLLSVEAQHLIAELRAKVQAHLLRLPVRAFEDTRSA